MNHLIDEQCKGAFPDIKRDRLIGKKVICFFNVLQVAFLLMVNNQVKNVERLKESWLKPGFCLPDAFDEVRLQTELLRKDPGNDAGLSVFNGMNYDSTGGMEH